LKLGGVKEVDFEIFALGIEVDILVEMQIKHESGPEFFE
jgi:hypothetical protein